MNQKYLKTTHDKNIYNMENNMNYTKLSKICGVVFKEDERVLAENFQYTKNGEVHKSFRYKLFKKQDRMVKFIDNHKWGNHFEVLTKDITKFYYDLDHLNNDTGYSPAEIKTLINDFIMKLNLFFNININKNDLLIYSRKEEDNRIRSVHIIIPKFSVHKRLNERFINLLLNTELFDNRIYTKNRNFCLPYNTKLKDTHENREFVPATKTTERAKTQDYLCSITDGTEEARLSEVMNCLDDLVSSVENSFTAEELNKYNCLNQPHKDDPNIIKVNQYDIVFEILKHLPTHFFTSNKKLWKQIINYLYIFDIEIDDLLRISAERSNGLYTHEKNIEWVEKIKKRDIDGSRNWNTFIQRVIIPLNQEYNKKFYFQELNSWDTKQLREWLNGETDIPLNELSIIFNKKKPTDGTLYLQLTDRYTFYVKAMDLLDKQENTTCNYWADCYYRSNLTTDISFNTNEEIKTALIEWFEKQPQKKLFNINGKWGCGKTHIFIKTIVKLAIESGIKVLLLTENNCLNASVYHQLQEIFKDTKTSIETHLDLVGKTGKKFNQSTAITITSLESIKRTGDNQYGLIILDEFESILNHYESDTFKYTTPYDSLTIVKEKLLGSDKILCLDADLSEERLKPIYKSLGIDEDLKIYYSNNNKWKEYDIEVILKLNEMRNMIHEDLTNNKRLTLAYLSKKEAEAQNKVLREQYPDKNILCIWSGLWEFNGIKLEMEEQENIKKNIEEFIIENEIDIWIYTPSVKTGLSFNHPTHFDKTYMTCNNLSCVPREAIQMLFRTRNLNCKLITIFLPKLSHISNPPSRERIQSHLIGGVKISILGEEENIHSNKELFNNDFYKEVITSNKMELFNRNSNFSHSFLHALIIKHQIPVRFIYEQKTTWGDIEETYKDAKKQLKHERVNTLMNTDLLPIKTHKELQEARKNYKFSNDEILKLEKRKLFNESGISGNTYEFKKYGNRIERTYNRGTETTKDIDGTITTINTDKSHSVEKNSQLIYEILTQNHPQASNIYFNNCVGYNTKEEEALNNENIKYIQYQVCKRIISKILPEFYTSDGNINMNTQQISVLEFNNRMKKMEEEIKTDYQEYHKIKELKDKMDWSKFKATNPNHKKKFYQLVSEMLKIYGMKIITPNNSSRATSKYTITQNTTKISDMEFIFIHKPRNHNGRVAPLIVADGDELNKHITITKNGKITTNKTKKQQEYCKKVGILDEKPIQLFKRCSSKWKMNGIIWKTDGDKQVEDGLIWKKVGVATQLTSYNSGKDPVVVEVDKEYEDVEEREMVNSIKDVLATAINLHYGKYRIKTDVNQELKTQYYFNIRKEIQPNQKSAGYLLESDDDDDDLMISQVDLDKFNNGIDSDTSDNDE